MLSHCHSSLICGMRHTLWVGAGRRLTPLAFLLLSASAIGPACADWTSGRDQRRQELRQALQTQRYTEAGDPNGEATVKGNDPGRRLTPEELLALRRQLQEMRSQRSAGSEASGKPKP
ncbi:MAG: hypothetical protein RL459_1289 [Pseudomonadota bacterium]|jgi:hypothetical protein